MNYAKMIEKLSPEKAAIIAVLPETALTALSAPSTPASVLDDVIARIEAGERFRVEDIDQMIREAKGPAKKRVSKAAAFDIHAEEAVVADQVPDPDVVIKFSGAIEATAEEPPLAETAADPVPSCDDLLAGLSEMIALTDEQTKKHPLCVDHMVAVERCLQKLVANAGDYSLIVGLGDLARETYSLRALAFALVNFGADRHPSDLRATDDGAEERLAA